MFDYDKTRFDGICIPYSRFSTTEQDKVGRKSLERQLEEAKRYARENNLYINEELIFADKGVSGFAKQGRLSKTFEKGQMSLMLEVLEDVPIEERENIYLCFHAFDRFSRQHPEVAYEQFTKILKRGFNIVTTIDDCVFSSKEDNLESMLISIIKMSSAHYESEVKSAYVSDAHKRRRDALEYLYNHPTQKGKHKHIGLKQSTTPRWIIETDTIYEFVGEDGEIKKDSFSRFSVDEAKAEIINQIFDWKIQGYGHTKICQMLNQRKVPTFEDGNCRKAKKWHTFAISNLFQNKSTIGTFILKTVVDEEYYCEDEGIFKTRSKKTEATSELENYFPAVVSVEKYEAALRAIESNKTSNKTSKSEDKTHVFSQVMKCTCGSRMVFKGTKKTGKNKKVDWFEYLRCERAILKDGCDAENIIYKDFENAFLRFATAIDYKVFSSTQAKLKAKLKRIKLKQTRLSNEKSKLLLSASGLKKTFESIVSQNLDATLLLESISKNEQSLEALQSEIAKIEEQVERIEKEYEHSGKPIDKRTIKRELKSDEYSQRLVMRRTLNEQLKRNIVHMEVCSTKLLKFVIVCFDDYVVRTYAYQDEFASDLMYNTIKINIENLDESEAYNLIVKIVKAVQVSLSGRNGVITNQDLKNYLSEIKEKEL
ncbi:Resolvase/invertase-type recombinase catalytic domain-containing protein [Vibrio jasicida]|uniref:Resolvase/invertase-type recombinase catalytic domain-containing protein n=1 Tax=Vibrio jasicida TaxID=766224 RepID=A0AAU9QXU6_9VIBR|nr:Resolvase/invertase-type recombinase catalytic domain-containing protein [Vibrio jasicida]CAH1603939.1 Resolvase/invertase-type recombinase catalytic domain-containing protein [Vibrio jasicida]